MKKLLSVLLMSFALFSSLSAQELTGKMKELSAKAEELSAKSKKADFGANPMNMMLLRKDFDDLLKECAVELASNEPKFEFVYDDTVEALPFTEEDYTNMTISYGIEKPMLIESGIATIKAFCEKIQGARKSIEGSDQWGDKVTGFPWTYADDIESDNWLKKANSNKADTYSYTFALKNKAGEELAVQNVNITISYEKKLSKFSTSVKAETSFTKISIEKAGTEIPSLVVTANEEKSVSILTKMAYEKKSVDIAKKNVATKKKSFDLVGGAKLYPKMAVIPEKNYTVAKTEVSQKLYVAVIGENPSHFKTAVGKEDKNYLPVENVSWYDAIYFCNLLSLYADLTPVYSVDGVVDVTEWDYTPHAYDPYGRNAISGNIRCNFKANGYRLPTVEEWKYAYEGGKDHIYSGSNNLYEVGWYYGNSNERTHEVAIKKPNGYGIYDMSGNVSEWCWDSHSDYRYTCGSSWDSFDVGREERESGGNPASHNYKYIGFRLFRTVK